MIVWKTSISGRKEGVGLGAEAVLLARSDRWEERRKVGEWWGEVSDTHLYQ